VQKSSIVIALKTPMTKSDFPKQGRGEKNYTHTTSETETLKK
jgi:hypothetical protein